MTTTKTTLQPSQSGRDQLLNKQQLNMKKPPYLIGLTGYAGCGKDSVRALLEEHGYHGFAFADPIRMMLHELLTSSGISTDYMRQRSLKEAVIPALGVSYRHLAQSLGTEWGRCLASDFWLRLADAYMESVRTGAAHIAPRGCVVSDVRFENEATWVRAHGGVVWRVDRFGVSPVRDHVSESAVATIKHDATIANHGSLDDLRRAVQRQLGVTA